MEPGIILAGALWAFGGYGARRALPRPSPAWFVMGVLQLFGLVVVIVGVAI